MVRIPRCGRGDLGSIPSEIKQFFFLDPLTSFPVFLHRDVEPSIPHPTRPSASKNSKRPGRYARRRPGWAPYVILAFSFLSKFREICFLPFKTRLCRLHTHTYVCTHYILTNCVVDVVVFFAQLTWVSSPPRIWALLSRSSWRRAAQPPRAFALDRILRRGTS